MNNKYIKNAFIGLFFSIASIIHAQHIAINQAGNPGNASAILDLSDASNNTLGVLFPNVDIGDVSLPAPITSPVAGLIVWNTNSPTVTTGGFGAGYYYWSGSQWLYIFNNAITGPVNGLGIANYSAKWISASTLSTGVGQDNGTGFGISSAVITP